MDDWRRTVRRQRAARRAARIPAPLHDDGYRSLLVRAVAARSMLVLSAAIGVVTALVLMVWTFRVDDPQLVHGPTTVDLERLGRAAVGALLATVAVTAVSFVVWAVRGYRNLPALAIEERRYWTIWLVIGWLIPGANLFVPKLLVDDLWRASSPSAGVVGGAGWHRRPVASIVNRWWCSFLLTPSVVVLAAVRAAGGLAAFEQQLVVGALSALAACSIVVAATAARRMVAVVTVAQARRADVICEVRETQRQAFDHLAAMTRFAS